MTVKIWTCVSSCLRNNSYWFAILVNTYLQILWIYRVIDKVSTVEGAFYESIRWLIRFLRWKQHFILSNSLLSQTISGCFVYCFVFKFMFMYTIFVNRQTVLSFDLQLKDKTLFFKQIVQNNGVPVKLFIS